MTAFGKQLIQAAKEVRAIASGEADPATYRVRTPADVDVKAIRTGQKLTQAEFAARYGFSHRHLTGHRAGPGKARRLDPRLSHGHQQGAGGRAEGIGGGLVPIRAGYLIDELFTR